MWTLARQRDRHALSPLLRTRAASLRQKKHNTVPSQSEKNSSLILLYYCSLHSCCCSLNTTMKGALFFNQPYSTGPKCFIASLITTQPLPSDRHNKSPSPVAFRIACKCLQRGCNKLTLTSIQPRDMSEFVDLLKARQQEGWHGRYGKGRAH